MKDVVEGVEVMTPKGKKGFLSKSELGFGYRSSKLQPDTAIMRVHLKFSAGDSKAVKKKMDEVRGKRAEKGAIGLPSAGCVFKNPVSGDGAGKLIDEAGLKGMRSGGAVISERHANYIVNAGEATARDVLALMAIIRDKVFSTRGVVLEPEIKVVGED
jgi:UDP-N-acetylmuramate dehydrogenase